MATREAIRQAVGSNLNTLHPVRPTIATASTLHLAPFILNSADIGGYVYYKDQQVVITGTDNLTDGAGTHGVLAVDPELTGITEGDEVELWTDARWGPIRVNRFIDQAVRECIRRIYIYAPPLYYNVTARSRMIPLPDDWAMVQSIFGRRNFGWGHSYEFIYSTEEFTSNDANTEITQERYDYRGTFPSTRITELQGSDPTVSVEFSTRRLTGMTHYEGWFKATGDITGITMRVYDEDDTDLIGQDITVLDADAVGDWEYVQIPIAEAAKLENASKIVFTIRRFRFAGDGEVWFNGLWGVDQDSVNWQEYDRRAWQLEHSKREIEIFPQREWDGAPWSLVRIVGGKDPAPYPDDETDNDIDDWFLICRATDLALLATSGGRGTDPDSHRQLARYWQERAEMAKTSAFPTLVNIRRIRRVQ